MLRSSIHHKNAIALCSSEPALATGFAFEVALAAARGSQDITLPEWIQLSPRGLVTTRDNRQFSFDPEKLVAAFKRDGLKLPIDFEHESNFTATLGAKPARSWIVDLEPRPAGLFGRIEWLDDAVQALKAKSFRYISPTFALESDRKTARHMIAAALCASPALSGMPAITSSTLSSIGDRLMKTLLAKLGLTENATEEEAVAKLSALTPDPAGFVPVAQLTAANTELAALRAEIDVSKQASEVAKCQGLIDKGVSDGKITPAAKDHYMSFAKADFAACSAAIAVMPVLLGTGQDKAIEDAEKNGAGVAALSADEAAVAKGLGLTADQYATAKAA
jgi:phage I-like protein